MTQLFFFTLAFLIYTLTNAYIFHKGWRILSHTKTAKILYSAVYFFLYSSFMVAMLGRNVLSLDVQRILYFPGSVWLAGMFYLFLFFVVTDLIYFAIRLFYLPSNKKKIKFRKIQVISGYFLIICLSVYGYFRFTHPEIVEQEIVIHKKAGDYKELKAVGVSDIHLGTNIGKKRLKQYVELINAQNPSIIIIAGDLIDNNLFPLEKERMWEEINRLQAPLGVYFCLGNHEYMSGIENSLSFLQKTKLHVLIDRSITIDNSFRIIGRDDIKGNPNRKALKDLVEESDPALPLFLLDHEPYHLEDAEKSGIDLQFSGHTHNGQIWPINLFVKKMYELGYGYKQKGETHYFVTSGLGLWGPPFRIATQSELIVFNIKFD